MNIDILVPPKQNYAGRVIHIETTQKRVGFFMREVVHRVVQAMSGPLQDAAVEIGMSKKLQDNPGFYRMMKYDRISGMAPEELKAYQIDILARYGRWRDNLLKESPQTLNMVTSFCQEEESIDSLRKRFHISERKAKWRLIYGLNEYSVLAGWGNQIEGAR